MLQGTANQAIATILQLTAAHWYLDCDWPLQATVPILSKLSVCFGSQFLKVYLFYVADNKYLAAILECSLQ